MAVAQSFDFEYDINTATYDWSVRLFRTLKKLLRVHLKLHADKADIEKGDIFLFNHFARFETFIPQYLIYEKTGVYCCSVASGEFFQGDDVLSNYLRDVGAIPNNYERLLPLLAAQILRRRKVMIFPEGGMVKDRRVVDGAGKYSVYSRKANNRRKHHTGAAVLALGLDVLKSAVIQAHDANDKDSLRQWVDALHLETVEALLSSAQRPTRIVPANITFYPIRVGDNILRKGVELVNKGITRRLSEELLIEGNILLKDTDMDIRLGEAIYPSEFWTRSEKKALARLARDIRSADDVFNLDTESADRNQRIVARGMRQNAEKIRDEYMHSMYSNVTVNLSHLASSIILRVLELGESEVDRDTFHKALYLAVKKVQGDPMLHLHRSLGNPDAYNSLITGYNKQLEQFVHMSETSGLIELYEDRYRFLPKLCEQYDFDTVRTQNLMSVYANEVAPLPRVVSAVEQAVAEAPKLDPRTLARFYFDDEIIAWRWDKQVFSKPRYEAINKQETATESGEPFFLIPENGNGMGLVLAHGLLASPAEVRPFGQKLFETGYTVIGVRLKGHGTSPWDLRERSWEDWYESFRRAYAILLAHTEQICFVGFSTGGALALRLAAEQPDGLKGVAAVSVPIKFRDIEMMLVPIVHRTNTLVRWISSYEGIKPFRFNKTEHPDINYRNMPIRGLYELRRLVGEVEKCLGDIHCPALIMQASRDPIVDPKSAVIIYEKLATEDKTLQQIDADRHGILLEDIGNTHKKLLSFLDFLCHSQ
jgi:esterase/lipase